MDDQVRRLSGHITGLRKVGRSLAFCSVQPDAAPMVEVVISDRDCIRQLRKRARVSMDVAPEAGQPGAPNSGTAGAAGTANRGLHLTSGAASSGAAGTAGATGAARNKFVFRRLVSVELAAELPRSARFAAAADAAAAASNSTTSGTTHATNPQKRFRRRVQKPCKWFLQGKACPVAAGGEGACDRRHEFASKKEEAQVMAKRASLDMQIAHGESSSSSGGGGSSSSSGGGSALSSRRGMVFGEWLVRTYGAGYLNSGSGVVDVAGGKQFVSRYGGVARGKAGGEVGGRGEGGRRPRRRRVDVGAGEADEMTGRREVA
jgi:hypothetical protein